MSNTKDDEKVKPYNRKTEDESKQRQVNFPQKEFFDDIAFDEILDKENMKLYRDSYYEYEKSLQEFGQIELEKELNKWDRLEEEMAGENYNKGKKGFYPFTAKTKPVKNKKYANYYKYGLAETADDILTVENMYNEEYIASLKARAETKDSAALNELGVVYFTLGDMPEASKCFTQAAEAGNIEAKRNLAITMENSGGADLNKIFSLYVDAAEKEDIYALNNLGCCYLNGEGTEQNYQKAIECFEKAAGLKDDLALLNLATCYSFGLGIDKNLEKAFSLYKEAAKFGNNAAVKMIADSYFNGRGVKQDIREALKYYRAAAKAGDKDSEKIVEKITKAQQKAAAQKPAYKHKEAQAKTAEAARAAREAESRRKSAENKAKEKKDYDRSR
ncbi:MAG: sel1 repeat family protein [Clostridiales bacterium]|nr:sel1 repeat family protein [Clostridiales bacterium]